MTLKASWNCLHSSLSTLPLLSPLIRGCFHIKVVVAYGCHKENTAVIRVLFTSTVGLKRISELLLNLHCFTPPNQIPILPNLFFANKITCGNHEPIEPLIRLSLCGRHLNVYGVLALVYAKFHCVESLLDCALEPF